MVAVAGVAVLSGATRWLSLPGVLAGRQDLQAWAAAHPATAVLGFVAAYVVAAAVALPGAAVLSLLGGFLFGRWLGTALVIIGATLGAASLFLVARSAVGAPLRRRAGPLYEKISSGVQGNAVEVLLFARLVPLFPFFLVNVAAALFDIRLSTFLLTTAVGIAPAAFIYNSVGRELGTVTSLSGLLSPGALAALLGLAALSLLPVAFRIAKGRARGGAGP